MWRNPLNYLILTEETLHLQGELSGTPPKGSTAAKKASKRTSKTAEDFVNEANQALSSLEAKAKSGVQQAETSAEEGVSKAKQGFSSANTEARKEATSVRDKGEGHAIYILFNDFLTEPPAWIFWSRS